MWFIIGGETCVLMLEDVLYIPTNKQNLISLGRWDKAGGQYMGGDGQLHHLVKWEGFRVEYNSWEPWDNIHTPE